MCRLASDLRRLPSNACRVTIRQRIDGALATSLFRAFLHHRGLPRARGRILKALAKSRLHRRQTAPARPACGLARARAPHRREYGLLRSLRCPFSPDVRSSLLRAVTLRPSRSRASLRWPAPASPPAHRRCARRINRVSSRPSPFRRTARPGQIWSSRFSGRPWRMHRPTTFISDRRPARRTW